MPNLTRANRELFRRSPDERFPSLVSLWEACHERRQQSNDHWVLPQDVRAVEHAGQTTIAFGEERPYLMNDWAFGQLCRLAGVNRDTVNRLKPATACQVFAETLPVAEKPIQILTTGDVVRSIHGVSYTRLWDSELLSMIREFATDFEPPQQADGGATGLYAGEQDMFAFLIDPLGWTEIEGEAFAPGFFVWNSEVGRRSVGVQTFWFQAVCRNHIVWDATEVAEVKRKHTANVHESLGDIRRMVEALVEKRDARKDGFANTIKAAMQTRLGNDADDVLKLLGEKGFTKSLARQALEIAREHGGFTVFSVVDALTRIAGKMSNAGDRALADEKASQLLALAV